MGPRNGSNNMRLLQMAIGERIYIETTYESYMQDMRHINTPKSRRPAALAGREFTVTLYTAVGSKANDIRYLICLERLK